MNIEKFVKNVENLCEVKSVSATKACMESGLSRSFLTDLRGKSQNPRIESLERLAKYFGVTLSELLGENLPVTGTVAEADRRLLDAYHAAPPDLQAAVRRVLGME